MSNQKLNKSVMRGYIAMPSGSNRWKNEITPIHIARAADIARETMYRNIAVLVKMYADNPDRLERLLNGSN